MNSTLEQLGITKEDILDRVAGQIVDQLGEDAAQDIRKFVTSKVQENILKTVDALVSNQARAAFETVFQPVDAFGEKVGSPTTLREAFLAKCKQWWTQKVDKEGRPSSGYGADRTMAQHHAGEVVRDLISKEMQKELIPLMGQAHQQLAQAVLNSIADIVNRNFKLQ